MSWQALIILQTLLISISTLAIRALTRQKKLVASIPALNAVQSCIFYLGALCLLPLLEPVELSKIFNYWEWFVAGGILQAIGNLYFFKLLSHLDAGFSTILITSTTLFTIFFASIILHEELTLQQTIGGTVLFAGIFYGMIVARQHHKRIKNTASWRLGLLFGIFACSMLGLAMVNEKFLLGHVGRATYVVYGTGAQALASLAVALIIAPHGFRGLGKGSIIRLNLLSGLSRSIAGVLLLTALFKSNNVALVSVVTNFKLIVVILLAALFLKEHKHLPQKLLAALIAIIGLSITFWR
jgi:drug/metabolite transporter (DMT)-like permease